MNNEKFGRRSSMIDRNRSYWTTSLNTHMAQSVSSKEARYLIPKKVVKVLRTRNDLWGFVFLVFHVGLTIVTGSLIYFSIGTAFVIPAMIAHGVVLACYFAPYHECSHNTAFKSNALNNIVYWVCGLILISPPTRFMYSHLKHHAYTNHVELDPQNLQTAEKPLGWVLYASGLTILSLYAGQMLRFLSARTIKDYDYVYLPKEVVSRVVMECRIFWAIYLGLIAVSVYFETWIVALYWFLPRIMGEWFQSTVRLSEHVGCSYDGEIRERTRTVYSNRILTWLCWNMPYHVEHHAFPNLPFHALPAANEYFKNNLIHSEHGYVRNLIEQIRYIWRPQKTTSTR